jgi:hypothetical protein
MPHNGLMNEQALGPVAAPLQRARLHIRGGRRRLREGKISAGIATIADALSAALEWRAAAGGNGHWRGNAEDERAFYGELVRTGKVSGAFDFDAFDRLTERALNGELATLDPPDLMHSFETLMIELGVMPFDEAALPREDPRTF